MRWDLLLFLSIVIVCFTFTWADDPDDFPEPTSINSPMPKATYARKAMVAAAHPLAAKAGVEILKAGGNAIDATVAVQMILGLVEPQSSGIGGGSFIVYYDAGVKKVFCVDGREECPALASRNDFLDSKGKVVKDDMLGTRSSGVPGTVAAMYLAHQKWGKLSWKQVLQPAIELARSGFGVTPRFREAIASNQRRLSKFASSKSYFFGQDGSVPEIGVVIRNPDYARTLDIIAEQGPDGFYKGEVAEKIISTIKNDPVAPGKMTLEDLANYRAVFRSPVSFQHQGYEIFGMPAPSSGTYTLGLMCGLLEPISREKRRPGTLEEIDLWCRAEAVAFADRNAYLGDQDWSPFDMSKMLDPKRFALRRTTLANLTSGAKAEPGPVPGTDQAPLQSNSQDEGTDTTHYSIVDSAGNVVACTTTIETGMGCANMVAGCGFLLNNELTDFDLNLVSSANAMDNSRKPRRTALMENTAPAGKRPRSSMTPLIVMKSNKPYLTIGSPGGSQIIGIVGQALIGVLDFDLDVQSAINLPRMSCRNGPLLLEELYPNRTQLVKQLEAKGWKVTPMKPSNSTWGGAHGIRILPDGRLEGGFDPRREGAVRGID